MGYTAPPLRRMPASQIGPAGAKRAFPREKTRSSSETRRIEKPAALQTQPMPPIQSLLMLPFFVLFLRSTAKTSNFSINRTALTGFRLSQAFGFIARMADAQWSHPSASSCLAHLSRSASCTSSANLASPSGVAGHMLALSLSTSRTSIPA
jgi:hypothetical protein